MQIIVEDGKGRPDANSFVPLEKLTFYRDYYGFRIPEAQVEQVELLLRAAACRYAHRRAVPAGAAG